MTGEVIKSFLVGLGFEVDDAGLSKFNKSIAQATLRVSALYGSIQAASGAVAFGISKISQEFENLGYEYKIIAPAINKALILRREMLRAYSAAGVNLSQVVQASLRLNLSLTKTRYAFDALYKSVASRFFPLLTKQSDLFRKKLYDNMPKIQSALEHLVQFLFKAFDATIQLGTRLFSILSRVYDFFASLHTATDGWSTVILGVVAAWKLLNLSFLATPLGLIITGLTAILALYDDFKTFQEGGQAFFDWSKAIPGINQVIHALNLVIDFLNQIWDLSKTIGNALYDLILGDFTGALDGALNALKSFGKLFYNPNAAQNIGQGPIPYADPGAHARNSQTNQNVNQQTNITVQGSANATAVGVAVASEQERVNFNVARYLRSRTQ